jgi:hypothetical protein
MSYDPLIMSLKPREVVSPGHPSPMRELGFVGLMPQPVPQFMLGLLAQETELAIGGVLACCSAPASRRVY